MDRNIDRSNKYAMPLKEVAKYKEEIQKHFYKCKHCGHKEFIRYDENKTICRWCGWYIFKSDKDEFKERLGGLLSG